jgi:hypothetical protein
MGDVAIESAVNAAATTGIIKALNYRRLFPFSEYAPPADASSLFEGQRLPIFLSMSIAAEARGEANQGIRRTTSIAVSFAEAFSSPSRAPAPVGRRKVSPTETRSRENSLRGYCRRTVGGEIDLHRLLDYLMTDLSGPIVLRAGQTHKYGHELIVTWPLARGLRDAICVRTCFRCHGATGRARRRLRTRFRHDSVGSSEPVLRTRSNKLNGVYQERDRVVGGHTQHGGALDDVCQEKEYSVIASNELLDRLTLPLGVERQSLGLSVAGQGARHQRFALVEA